MPCGMYLHAAMRGTEWGGAARRRGRGFTHPEQSGGRAQRRSAQAKRGRLGKPLRRARAKPSAACLRRLCAHAHRIFRHALRAGTSLSRIF